MVCRCHVILAIVFSAVSKCGCICWQDGHDSCLEEESPSPFELDEASLLHVKSEVVLGGTRSARAAARGNTAASSQFGAEQTATSAVTFSPQQAVPAPAAAPGDTASPVTPAPSQLGTEDSTTNADTNPLQPAHAERTAPAVPGDLPRLVSQSEQYSYQTGGVAWTLTAIFLIVVLCVGIAVIFCSGLEDTIQDMATSLKKPMIYDTAPTVTSPKPKTPAPRGGASPQPQQASQEVGQQTPQAPRRLSAASLPMSPSASSRAAAASNTALSARLKHPPAKLFVPTLRGQTTGLFDVRDAAKNSEAFLQVSLSTTLIKPPEEYVQLLDMERKELGICGYYPKGTVGGNPNDFMQLHLVGHHSDEQEFAGHLIRDGAAIQLIRDERLLLMMKITPERQFEICGKRNNVLAQVSWPSDEMPNYTVGFAHGCDYLQILLFLIGADRLLHYDEP